MAKPKQDPHQKINICYELDNKKRCLTLPITEAKALKQAVEKEGGITCLFLPVNQ